MGLLSSSGISSPLAHGSEAARAVTALKRRVWAVLAVGALHLLVLFLLWQTPVRVDLPIVEPVVMAVVLPAVPRVLTPVPPQPAPTSVAVPKSVPKPTTSPSPAKPLAMASALSVPSPAVVATSSSSAVDSVPATVPATTAPTLVPVAAPAPLAAAVPVPAKVELPSTDADYLHNPRPAYPLMSKRLGEQGRVVLRVLIETDGSASKAELRQSSGHERLDQAALKTVLQWRYVPGKRNGVAEAMWFNVPINFVLE